MAIGLIRALVVLGAALPRSSAGRSDVLRLQDKISGTLLEGLATLESPSELQAATNSSIKPKIGEGLRTSDGPVADREYLDLPLNDVQVRLASLVEVHSSTNLTKKKRKCREMKGVKVKGHSIGPVLWLICWLWPKRFGEFPIEGVLDAEKVGETIFEVGGVFDMAKKLAKKRMKSEKFCWRRDYMREPLQPAGYSCPSAINYTEANELLEEDDAKLMSEGQWACQRATEANGGMCSCGRSDLPNFRSDDVESLPAEARARIHTMPEGCDMVSFGTCYGECPYGFQPALVTGGFRPVCSTRCSESNHPVACGFGCANTAGNCAKVVGKQVAQVVKLVGMVAGFVTGHPQIHMLVDALISIVEFTVTVLAKFVKAVVKAWKTLQAGKKKLGLVLTILQFAAEVGLSVIGDVFQMQKVFKSIVSLFMELINGEWKFGLNLNIIGGIFKKFGAQPIITGFQVVSAFVWPKCKVANNTAIFSIDEVGDPRLRGEWMRQGSHSGRPRYMRIDEAKTRIEWSDKRKKWRAYHDDSMFGVRRKTLYTNSRNDPDVPTFGWKADRGELPAPMLKMLVH